MSVARVPPAFSSFWLDAVAAGAELVAMGDVAASPGSPTAPPPAGAVVLEKSAPVAPGGLGSPLILSACAFAGIVLEPSQ
jgi:hypothetical protein